MTESDVSRVQRERSSKHPPQPQTSTETFEPVEDFTRLNPAHINTLTDSSPPDENLSRRTRMRPADVLRLQRTIGNAAVQRMLAAPRGTIQRDFEFDGEKYNADRLAAMSISDLQALAGKMQVANAGEFAQAIGEVQAVVRTKQRLAFRQQGPPPIPGAPGGQSGGLPNRPPLPPKPLPKPPPKSNPAPAPAAGAPAAMPQVGGFDPVIITQANADATLAMLEEWMAYATRKAKDIEATEEYKKLDFYKVSTPEEKAELRPSYRKLIRDLHKPLKDSVSIVGMLRKYIGLEKNKLPVSDMPEDVLHLNTLYLGMQRSGRLEGLVSATSNHIDFLAKNPHSIAPEGGDPAPAKGLALALLVEVMKRMREIERASSDEYKPEPFELKAYSQTVKKIYQHYNFKVWDKDANQEIPRQKRGADGDDTAWHREDYMQLPLKAEGEMTGVDPATGAKV